jgi:hypothetical protein
MLFYQIKEEKRVVNVYCSVTMLHEGMLLYHKHKMYYRVLLYRSSSVKWKSDMEDIFKFLVIPSALEVPINQNMNL